MASELIRRFAELADRGISHPAAIPAYIAVSVALWWALDENTNTLVLSHFANLTLVLLSIAQARRAHKMECEIAALVRVDERIDEREIEDAAGRA